MRIVSLVPSATEILYALGLEDWLVGVTHECDYPPAVRHLPKVTQTLISGDSTSSEIDREVREQLKTTRALYKLDVPLLTELRPDLIVTQSLCDVCAVSPNEVQAALALVSGNPRVVNLEPQSLDGLFNALQQVASAVCMSADGTIRHLKARVEAVAARSAMLSNCPRVALLEWLDPPFSCGHWNPELVRIAGGVEGLGAEGQPSRQLHWEEILVWQPDVLFIACCGFDVERTLKDLRVFRSVSGWPAVPAVRAGRIYVADGSQYFNRPGPRLIDSLELLAHALHPDRHPLPDGLPPLHRVS